MLRTSEFSGRSPWSKGYRPAAHLVPLPDGYRLGYICLCKRKSSNKLHNHKAKKFRLQEISQHKLWTCGVALRYGLEEWHYVMDLRSGSITIWI